MIVCFGFFGSDGCEIVDDIDSDVGGSVSCHHLADEITQPKIVTLALHVVLEAHHSVSC